MSVKIRLSRGGAKKRPFYHIVAADSRQPRDGRFLEKLGFFNPMRPKDSPERTKLNAERIQYWLGVGAQPTERVQKILAAADLVPAPKHREQTKQHLPKAKAQERAAEKAAAAEAKKLAVTDENNAAIEDTAEASTQENTETNEAS